MDTEKRSGLTLTILGCGNLGQAILRGILTPRPPPSGNAQEEPSVPITRYIACVKHESSAKAIEAEFSQLTTALTVLADDNVRGVREADLVILGCEPGSVDEVLDSGDIRRAAHGKVLVSILAGVTSERIAAILGREKAYRCGVVRALPNTAAAIGASMTVIAMPEDSIDRTLWDVIYWVFGRIGRVVTLPARLMGVSTALCGSGPAFYALMLEAMADGGVAMGLPRKEAQLMAAQAMMGAAGLVLKGEHPALLRDKITTPGGCTIGGLQVMEERGVRGAIGRAVREATTIVGLLGQGKQGVNGTRN